jgi:hypothetical protein
MNSSEGYVSILCDGYTVDKGYKNPSPFYVQFQFTRKYESEYVYLLYLRRVRHPLWSRGQGSWLQIQSS